MLHRWGGNSKVTWVHAQVWSRQSDDGGMCSLIGWSARMPKGTPGTLREGRIPSPDLGQALMAVPQCAIRELCVQLDPTPEVWGVSRAPSGCPHT